MHHDVLLDVHAELSQAAAVLAHQIVHPVEAQQVQQRAVAGAQEDALVAVGLDVLHRVVAARDLRVGLQAPDRAGAVRTQTVAGHVAEGRDHDQRAHQQAVRGGAAVGGTGVGADGAEVAPVALAESQGAEAAHREPRDGHPVRGGAEVRVHEREHHLHDERLPVGDEPGPGEVRVGVEGAAAAIGHHHDGLVLLGLLDDVAVIGPVLVHPAAPVQEQHHRVMAVRVLVVPGRDRHAQRGREGLHLPAGVEAEVHGADVLVDPLVGDVQAAGVPVSAEGGGAASAQGDDRRGGRGAQEQRTARGRDPGEPGEASGGGGVGDVLGHGSSREQMSMCPLTQSPAPARATRTSGQPHNVGVRATSTSVPGWHGSTRVRGAERIVGAGPMVLSPGVRKKHRPGPGGARGPRDDPETALRLERCRLLRR